MKEQVLPVSKTLEDRGKDYGSFKDQTMLTQDIKRSFKSGKNWENLNDAQKESLEMIATKISRILNGNPNKEDTWHDIAGYATLVEKEIRGEGV